MSPFIPQKTYSISKHEGGRRLARYVGKDGVGSTRFHVLQATDNNQVVVHHENDIKEIEDDGLNKTST